MTGQTGFSAACKAADLKNGGPRYALSTPGGNSKRILFLNDRSWNLIENKGSLWKAGRRSWNVYENTGT
jgi:hypothetical protein